jgi:2-hydroxychromene-2-carboxylate isomerase
VAEVTFFFDLGSPYAYLAAERLAGVMPEPVRWQPILLGGLFKLNGRSSWAVGDAERRRAGIADLQARLRRAGLPPLVAAARWPGDYLGAMRAATFAFQVGRGRAFALEAFRDAFRRGVDLGDGESVLRVGERVGLERDALRDAIAHPRVKQALRDATERAHALGVIGVPTFALRGELFWGEDRLDDAAAWLRAAAGD